MAQFQRGRIYTPQKQREWVVYNGGAAFATNVNSGAQEVICDGIIEHAATNEDYGSGTVEGLRCEASVDYGANTPLVPPTAVVLILKSGETMPSLVNPALLKLAEDKIWMIGAFEFNGSATGKQFTYRANPKTSRKHGKGDRVVLVLINWTGTALPNPHTYQYVLEFYHVGG